MHQHTEQDRCSVAWESSAEPGRINFPGWKFIRRGISWGGTTIDTNTIQRGFVPILAIYYPFLSRPQSSSSDLLYGVSPSSTIFSTMCHTTMCHTAPRCIIHDHDNSESHFRKNCAQMGCNGKKFKFLRRNVLKRIGQIC